MKFRQLLVATVVLLLLAAVLAPLGSMFLIAFAVLLVPAMPIAAIFALPALIAWAARSPEPTPAAEAVAEPAGASADIAYVA